MLPFYCLATFPATFPVDGALSGKAFALVFFGAFFAKKVFLVTGEGKQRVEAQLVVIIDVLVFQGDGVNPLGQEVRQFVFHQGGEAGVGEAFGQLRGKAVLAVDLAKKEAPAVTGEVSPGKIGFDFARTQGLKREGLLSVSDNQRLNDIFRPSSSLRMRYAG